MTRGIGFTLCILLLLPLLSLTATADIDKKFRIEPDRGDLSGDYFVDFFTYFAPDALSLDETVMRAVYDILVAAARKIEGKDYEEAANLLAVMPDDVEGLMTPVVKMREDLSASDAIEPFAEHEARAELMKYHRVEWTSHPEFSENFKEFAEDFAKRASRREKDAGAPYIVEHLNDYGFVPKGEGGARQAYLFLWAKFNAISKFAAICDRLGLNYADVKIKDFHKSVSESLSIHINVSREEAWAREQGRASWTELIDQYAPEEPELGPVPETAVVPETETETLEPTVGPVVEIIQLEETPETEIEEPETEEPEVIEEPEEEEAPPVAEESEVVIETISEPVEEEAVVEEDVTPLTPLDEAPIEVVIDPMSLFLAPGEIPEEPEPEETIAIEELEAPVIETVEEEPVPVEEIPVIPVDEEPEILEIVEPFQPPVEAEIIEPVIIPVEEEEIVPVPLITTEESSDTMSPATEPVIYGDPIDPSDLPSKIDAVPIPPGEIEGDLDMGRSAEIGNAGTETVFTSGGNDEIRLQLAAVAEDAIDNAAEKALNLGRNALALAQGLSSDPNREKPETTAQLDAFRSARSAFLAAAALIDRYELEQYLQIPIEVIEEEIIAELRRPYDDLKASSAWEEYRGSEKDFDDAFLRIASDFRQRREKESIYSGEMAALEANIVEYEQYMLQLEELLNSLASSEAAESVAG